MKGTIFNIQKFCVHDGDGIRTIVFLKGCPLRCVWCHNPEGLSARPVLLFNEGKCASCGRCLSAGCGARRIEDGKMRIDREKCAVCGACVKLCLADACEVKGYEQEAEEVFREVMKDKIFYDTSGGGLTVSGGEPSFQPEFTLELLKMAEDAGIGRAVESCGIGRRAFYEKAADLGTTFLYDLKCMEPAKHRALTGADNARIIENLLYLFGRGADVIIRMPLVPGVNDEDDDILRLAAFLREHEGKYRYAEIMPYHTMGTGKARKLGEAEPFARDAATERDMERWTRLFGEAGVDVRISK